MIMEDKRTEAEKCNRWLRGMYYLVLWSNSGGYGRYGDDKDYEDFERDESRKYVKEKFETLVSKYLKMLESNDEEQRIFTIQSIIYHFKQDVGRLFDYDEIRERGIKDPRIFWFRRLVKEDISVVEICRILLTCQEIEDYEVGVTLGQEYVKDENNYYHSELDKSLVNKHIEVLQEKIRLREEEISRKEQEELDKELSGMDYRDYQDELREESWFAMTEGMYGDYEGDIDMDKLGY